MKLMEFKQLLKMEMKRFAFLVTPGGGEGELYFNIQNQSGWSSIYGGTPIS